MKLKDLKKRPEIFDKIQVIKVYTQLEQLLSELKRKELPIQIIGAINNEIEQLNSVTETGNKLKRETLKAQRAILKTLEKELKLVAKNHYRNLWIALGMSAFGVPLGVAFGMNMDNMGLLGVGLPIGIVFGLALGTTMDKKAFAAGRQLDLDLNS